MVACGLPRAKSRGSSTLEILIAFAILTLALTAVILVFSSNQDVAIDTETASEALGLAQAGLETARATSTQNFAFLESTNSTTTSGSLAYGKSLQVLDVSPCFKHATSTVTWAGITHEQTVELATYLSDVIGAFALGGGCDSTPPGDWTNPTTYGSAPPSVVDGKGTGVDVAIIGGTKYAFLTTSNSDPSKDDLWAFDVSNPKTPIQRDYMNIASSSNAVDVAHDYATGKDYAYIASNSQNEAGTCGPGNPKPFEKQFQIVDVSDPSSFGTAVSKTLSSVNPCGSYPAAVSVYYYDGKVYVGTKETGGDELTIFDVSDPTDPDYPVELDSISINRNVNAIIVRDGLAYLATGPGAAGVWNPFQIYDVDPVSPTYKQRLDNIVSPFIATGDEQGTSEYLIGNKLYLGLESTPSGRPDFFVLDVSDPTSPHELGDWRVCSNATPPKCLKLSAGTSHPYISGISVRSNTAFLSTTDSLQPFWVVNISDPTGIAPVSNCVPYNYSADTQGLVFSDNYIYVVDASNAGLRVIYGQPLACPL